MPVFAYKGKTIGGAAVSGQLKARNRAELARILRQQKILAGQISRVPSQININIGTGIKVAFARGIRETLAENPETDALRFLRKGTDRGRAFVQNKIRLLGSDGKA